MNCGTQHAMMDVALGPGVLIGDGDADGPIERIVRANDAADAILERRDDPAPVHVIFRIGAEHQAQVQLKLDRIATNLHVALFREH